MSVETEKPGRLQIFMRSGNSFVLDGVTDWKLTTRGDRVVGIHLVQKAGSEFTRLIVNSIDLAQIEAILDLPEVGS
jgi:hypothetical protein